MYQLHSSGVAVVRLNDDGTLTGIPTDPANTDYQEYQQWLAAGNTPDHAPAPPAPPAPPEPPTAIEKLAAAGLTVEELKALLAG